MYACLDCGRMFTTESSAEKACTEGCPNCEGTDIDLPQLYTPQIDTETLEECEAEARSQMTPVLIRTWF